jgi:S1-C subfamily serine protease
MKSQPQISEPEPRSPWAERATRARTQLRRAAPFTLGVLATLLALFLFNRLNPPPAPLTADEVSKVVAQAMASATPPAAYSARVYQAVQPALVLIQARRTNAEGHDGSGLGSGVIINEGGDILTSLHVVDGADEILLTFFDGSHAIGYLAAAQPENDIAVLVPSSLPPSFQPAVLGSPNAMRVGDEAFAVGNPFGLYSSMSAGVISGFGRSFQPANSEFRLEDLIQIDAAVNPGNSGGPLLNRSGQVVGIVVGIVNPTQDEVFIGIGFVVPIQTAAAAAGSPQH